MKEKEIKPSLFHFEGEFDTSKKIRMMRVKEVSSLFMSTFKRLGLLLLPHFQENQENQENGQHLNKIAH